MGPRRFLASILIALLVLAPGTSLAQDVPVVFLHGFNSSGDSWRDATARLRGRLAIEPQNPTVDWTRGFWQQADDLQSQVGWMPGNTVAVAHSNGGLLARQWSRMHSVGGILTTGTPHGGAPIMNHLNEFTDFHEGLFGLVGDVFYDMSVDYDRWWWVYDAIVGYLWWSEDLARGSLYHLLYTLGLHRLFQGELPVAFDEYVGSPYLGDLNNSGGNLAREAREIPVRVAVQNVLDDYESGGLYRLVAPQYATWISWSTIAGGVALVYHGIDLYIQDGSWDAWDKAVHMFQVGAWLLDADGTWCKAVSDPAPLRYAECRENDGFIPAWSQAYPDESARTLRRTHAPSHIEETSDSDDVVYEIMTSFMQVPDRSGGGGVPGPPAALIVSLQSDNGMFVVAEGGGGREVNANRSNIGSWETFVLVDLNGGELRDGDRVAFRTDDGHFLQAIDGGGNAMGASGNDVLSWETFTIVSMNHPGGVVEPEDDIALRSVNGFYVCAEGGGGDVVNVNRGGVGGWETFTLVVH
jgi:pimeloyl-ACP methyl ester carboxylesterase